MPRMDVRKSQNRPLFERTLFDGGESIITFRDDLYGESVPEVRCVGDGTRVVLPDCGVIAAWYGVEETAIWAHMWALAETDSGFGGACEAATDDRTGPKLRETVTGFIAGDTLRGAAEETQTRLMAHVRGAASPFEVAYLHALYEQNVTPQEAQGATQPEQGGPLVRQEAEKYLCRVRFDAVLYGGQPTLDIFIDTDVVLCVPMQTRWNVWLGVERAAFFGRVNEALLTDAALQGWCAAARDAARLAKMREDVVGYVPQLRAQLRADGGSVPFVRVAVARICGYMGSEASPLEVAIARHDCDRLRGG